jgi:hypothetical protein
MKTMLRMAKLPRGFGSLQKRRRTYWMIFTNAAGKKVQENTDSDRLEVANLMLAKRAQEKVAAMKVRVDEAAKAAWEALLAGTEAGNEARINRGPRVGERLVPNDASVVRTSAKGKRGSR